MTERTLERAFEEPIKREVGFAADVVKAASHAVIKKDPENEDNREGFGDIVVLLARKKANDISRGFLRRYGPNHIRRFMR